jgi:tripartite-type tricarboxylate transporter receptor subunit TctC
MRSIVGCLCLLAITGGALAQSFPVKPIKIIVPTSPGGLNDLLSRTLGQEISQSVGQPVITENRPGAGSMIGMLALAKSPPDGYTVAITTAEPLVYNPLLYKTMPYDAEKDFSYVSQLVRTLGAIIAPPSVPFNTFPEMIAYAKSKPGALNWATWGPGSTPAIYLEWIKRQNGVDIAAIPYKGAGPSLPATVSGEVQLTYTGIGLALPLIRSGKLKALAITGADVAPPIPDVPPLHKFNSDPGFASGFAVYAPAGVPPVILERLSAEFRIALRSAAAVKAMENNMVPVGSTPREFAAQIKTDRARAAQVLKALGIKPTDAPTQ